MGGIKMKAVGLILAILFVFSGCASFNHSEYIDTDQLSGSFASGKYQLSQSGPNGSFSIAGGGGGWGGGGGGVGAGAMSINTGPSTVSGLNFARSIAMINYSKRITSITYDEAGGIIDYEMAPQPVGKAAAIAVPAKPGKPSSFGYAPVE